MDMTISEGQKRMLTVIFTIVVVIFLYTFAIMPTNTKIVAATEEDKNLTKAWEDMSRLISNNRLEKELDELIKITDITFQDIFVPNESGHYIIKRLIEEIDVDTNSFGTQPEYTVVGEAEYIKLIAQPKTQEEFAKTKQIAAGGSTSGKDAIADLGYFQKNSMNVTITGTPENMIKVYDFLNNIPPVGVGDVEGQKKLYCWMIDKVSFAVENGKPVLEAETNAAQNLIYFGMAPPPLEKPEKPDRAEVMKKAAEAKKTNK